MDITLNWVSRNQGEDGTHIYRSSSPMNPADLPAPFATVGPGVTSYIDTAVVRDSLYYYRFGIFKGSDIAISGEIAIAALATTGPGPQTLLVGDHHAGYYGRVLSTELFDGDTLATAIGLTAGSSQNKNTDWVKFVRRGKILFTPLQPLRNNLSWKDVYDVGAALGVDSFGDILPTGVGGVNQKKIITKDDVNYLVRLPKGAPANPAVFNVVGGTAYESSGLEGSEYNELLYRIALTAPYSAQYSLGGDWANLGYSDLRPNSWAMLCQERLSSDPAKILTRMAGYGSNAFYPGTADGFPVTAKSESRAGATAYGSTTTTVYLCWRPILELVTDPV